MSGRVRGSRGGPESYDIPGGLAVAGRITTANITGAVGTVTGLLTAGSASISGPSSLIGAVGAGLGATNFTIATTGAFITKSNGSVAGALTVTGAVTGGTVSGKLGQLTSLAALEFTTGATYGAAYGTAGFPAFATNQAALVGTLSNATVFRIPIWLNA